MTDHEKRAVLIEAVDLVLESYSFIVDGTREPISLAMKNPENEINVFRLVISLNNLRKKRECQNEIHADSNDPKSLKPDNVRRNIDQISTTTQKG